MKAFLNKLTSVPQWPTGIRWGLVLVAWLGLTVCFFQPASHVLDGDLDPSIFTAYAYYTAHGFQFGPEVVAMGGPYAFIMYGEFYGGDLFWLRTGLELVVQGIFSALVLWFVLRRSPSPWIRGLWVLAHLLFTPSIADLPIAWTMLLAGFFLLAEPAPGRGPTWPILGATLLGWLALFKGTHLMLSFATVAVVTLAWIFHRNWRHALLLLGTYLTSLLGFWLLAQQNPLNLPAYLAGTFHLTQSYNSAMSVEEPLPIFWRGVAVAGGLIFALAITAWFRRRNILQVAGLALLAGFTFVMWKHGFVRADSHVVIFFCFAAVAVPTWYLQFATGGEGLPWATRSAALAAATLLLLTGLAGRSDPLRPQVSRLAGYLWPRLRDHANYLVHLSREKAQLELRLLDQRGLNELPETRDTVGGATIDYFGCQQGIVPLNGFNYHPRPMGAGAFNVYDRYLMELNGEFLRDPARRPNFYLVRPASIDNRLIAQDDGRALLELLQGYRPELIEQNQLLMRAVPGASSPAPRPVSRQSFAFGESVKVPVVADNEILFARFVMPSSWLGRLCAAFYKPPLVFINLQDRSGAAVGVRRLVPVMADSPFIFSPLLEDNLDLLNLYDSRPGRQPGSFVVTCPQPRHYAGKISVEFSAVARPPAMEPYALGGLRARLQFPFANAIPESITPPFKTHHVVRYLHAPSEAVWKLSGVEREFVFHYGIDPEAYERGTTNGVEFIVEVRGPSGGVTRAFSSMLKPLTRVADRGKHVARVQLPLYAPGSRLVLRTDPGEYGDTAWDWAYVTRIDIRLGRYTAEQFPGFNRVPESAEDEYAGVVEVDGAKALLLHIPGTLRFSLSGQEKHLAIDFGFMPGAYTGEGRTAGGDFVLALERRDQPPREIFRRALRPVAAPADRGRQSAKIALGDVAAGDVLVLRTAAPPGASNSWGWTYVARLFIE